jgi:hypothetical protein
MLCDLQVDLLPFSPVRQNHRILLINAEETKDNAWFYNNKIAQQTSRGENCVTIKTV